MIQPRSMLKVADNSGAVLLQVFHVLGGSRKRYARIGDIVVCAVKAAEPHKEIKKGSVVKALLVRQKATFHRSDGTFIRFDENAAVILDKGKEPKGGRIFGPLPREIKEKGYDTIISLAPEIV